jgi:prolyl-tRNA synthetase
METQVNQHYSAYFETTYGCPASAENHTADQGASGATLSVFLAEKAKGKTIFIATTPYFSPESGMAKSAGLEVGVAPLPAAKSWAESMNYYNGRNKTMSPSSQI